MQSKSVFLALAAAAGLSAAGVHADTVYWSVGVSQPGAQVVVGNVPPPHRVYVPAPVPVVVQPVPAYPVVYPVVYPVAQPVWVPPGHRHWHHGWREHHERMEHRGPQGHYELAPSDRR